MSLSESWRLKRNWETLLSTALADLRYTGCFIVVEKLEAYPVKNLKLVFETPFICDRLASETDTRSLRVFVTRIIYRGADKSLAPPGRKQATATEYFEFHISYL